MSCQQECLDLIADLLLSSGCQTLIAFLQATSTCNDRRAGTKGGQETATPDNSKLWQQEHSTLQAWDGPAVPAVQHRLQKGSSVALLQQPGRGQLWAAGLQAGQGTAGPAAMGHLGAVGMHAEQRMSGPAAAAWQATGQSRCLQCHTVGRLASMAAMMRSRMSGAWLRRPLRRAAQRSRMRPTM